MSRGVQLSTLSALSDDATLAALAVIQSSEMNTHRSGRRSLINNLLTAIQDAESLYAGSGEPTDKPQGKAYFDTATSLWMGYKTANGTPVTFADSALAYTVDFATAGTATFRKGGILSDSVLSTDSALTGTGDFAQTYSLPAGTLARDGQGVHVVWWGTRSGAAGTFSLAPYFGSAAGTAVASTVTSITDWIIEMWVFRTGAATQDFAWKCSFNRDDTGSTTLVDTGTLTETLSGAVTIKLNLSAISAGTVTQAMMFTEFLNY